MNYWTGEGQDRLSPWARCISGEMSGERMFVGGDSGGGGSMVLLPPWLWLCHGGRTHSNKGMSVTCLPWNLVNCNAGWLSCAPLKNNRVNYVWRRISKCMDDGRDTERVQVESQDLWWQTEIWGSHHNSKWWNWAREQWFCHWISFISSVWN